MEMFNVLIKDQFVYGGKKYALNSARESTDILFEQHGKNWLFGTMDKYTFRFKNLSRERDILKIACYSYILWLKKGFFVKDAGLIDVIDTTVEMKTLYFDKFLERLSQNIRKWQTVTYAYLSGAKTALDIMQEEGSLETISSIIQGWSHVPWTDLKEDSIQRIYYLCYSMWQDKFSNVQKHDTDTYNK